VTPLLVVLIAAGALAALGSIALVFARAGVVATWGGAAACAAGIWAALGALGGPGAQRSMAWPVPGGHLVVGIDALSAFFLVPLFAIGTLVTIYGRAYMADRGPRARARSAGLLNVMLAAMTLVLVARHGMVFVVAWEAMTLVAYLLITTDHEDAEVRRAGWVFLIASHVAVLALLGLFVVLADRGGSFDFSAFRALDHASPSIAVLVFALAIVGFGVKAGVLGLHVWLPEAHAAAPSHVSALMSAVMIKLGIYGIIRVTWSLPATQAFGAVVMALGMLGALYAIALALYQRDLKRSLAYSSIENVGIALVGIGLGMWAHARGDTALCMLGLAGGLLHVWNHAAMKALMFLGAGEVVHATGTKDLERLGGLLRRMRITGTCMVIGAVAIAALPPLNAFVGEWLIYRGLVTAAVTPDAWSLPAMAAVAALALVGGLAALCFVRIVGIALLGEPRSEQARRAHEGPRAMTVPLAILAGSCIALGLVPRIALRALEPLLERLAGPGPAASTATGAVAPIAIANAALLLVVVVAGAIVIRRFTRAAADDTWGCGYLAPGPRIQYTGRAFAELMTGRVLPRPLRERERHVSPTGPFPGAAAVSTDCTDPLTRVYEPVLARWGDRFARLRWLQQGNLHAYLLYIVAIAVLGLAWVNVRGWWAT